MSRRKVIVNADDLGYDPEIDRGILQAWRCGVVSSASAMVDTDFAPRALGAAPEGLGVGLHLVLPPELTGEALEVEIDRQLRRFVALRGRPPTHLDSHKHAHARPAALAAVTRAALGAGLPVRALHPAMRRALRGAGVIAADDFLGDASLRPCWTPARLLAALEGLGEGTTEIMAHPGYRPAVARTSFGWEREEELKALCDPRIRRAIDRLGIDLAHY